MKIAMHTVARMKVLEERNLRKAGGGAVLTRSGSLLDIPSRRWLRPLRNVVMLVNGGAVGCLH